FYGPTDRFKLFDVATSGEDREACQQALGAGVEHVIAPENRASECLLSDRRVSCPAAKRTERFLQPAQECLRRKKLDPGRRQLDGQRKAVDTLANARNSGSVLVCRLEIWLDRDGSLDEEPHGLELRERRQSGQGLEVGQRERRNRKFLLPRDAQ